MRSRNESFVRKFTPQESQNAKDEEKWGIVGLLHDADYELTKNHPEKHTLVLQEKIGKKLPADVMYAIMSHNFANNKVLPKAQWIGAFIAATS